MKLVQVFIILFLFFLSCHKKEAAPPVIQPQNISIKNIYINNAEFSATMYGVSVNPGITVRFSGPVMKNTAASSISLSDVFGVSAAVQISFPFDSVALVSPTQPLSHLKKYLFKVNTTLQSASGGGLISSGNADFITGIDSSRKFPAIADDSLLTLVQKQTFKYFWDFGHPVCGMARERNSSGETVTTGGTGFGIMAIPVAVNRNFISRAEGLTRVQKIVNFLKTTPPRFHGAFSHWMNGTTGAVVPFGSNDNGADIVETSYLMMGLLTARQYFDGADAAEMTLRDDINNLWQGVEWDWFRRGGKNILYWNWSPDFGWAVNVPVQGWNECLITYVMAASSPTHPVPKAAYDSGFARNGAMVNNATYYGYKLPLGPVLGGPLFFEHYSFLGINPAGLRDAYADYEVQTKNHSLINYEYCRNNPKNQFGYSDSTWGLTASDIPNGYTASSPTNDVGVIAPTAAISSLPYTPEQSLKALKFFYYVLGDRLWKEYGFVDAYSLKDLWFASSFLAIDQGPIIVMIENYRSGLLWNLFTSCPEIKTGLTALGFTAPYL